MAGADTFVDYYAILEIARDADDEQIRSAVKQQRRTWAKRQGHPDQQRRHEAEARIQQLAEAERTLLDSTRRQQFEQKLANHQPPSTPTSQVSGDWIERTLAFLERGDAYSANYAAREATTLDSSSDEAWALRAQSSLLLGNLRDAVFELSEALRIAPENAGYHFDLGSVYEADSQWDPALRSYEQASRLVPDNITYQVAVASVLLEKGHAQRALPILEAAAKKAPDSEMVNFYLAAALLENAVSDWPGFHGGAMLPVTEAQAKFALQKLERASKLRTGDSELDATIREGIDLCNEALEQKLRLAFFRLQLRRASGFGYLLQFWGHPGGSSSGFSLLASVAMLVVVAMGVVALLAGFTGEVGAFFGGLFWGGLGAGGLYLLWNKPGWWVNAEELKWDRSEIAEFVRSRAL